jgi:hypothetical protein
MLAPPTCKSIEDVYNSNVYEKSICLVEYSQPYANSRANCLRNFMRLYSLSSSPEARSSLLNYAFKRWSTKGSFFYVDGSDDFGCMSIVNNNSTGFVPESTNCTRWMWSFCEFLNLEGELVGSSTTSKFIF